MLATFACSQAGTPSEIAASPVDVIAGPELARVLGIEIRASETKVDEAEIWATGSLPDHCHKVGDITEERGSGTIKLTMYLETVERDDCGEDLIVDFLQIVPLDISDLVKGEYILLVNNSGGTFEIDENGQIR